MNNKEKILIVEDERVIRNVITSILRANSYAVLQAETGNEAVSMVASHVPDLMLLDLGLPDTDGLDVLANIRKWSEVPIIIVSARQEEHEKVGALDAGANDYITKPFGHSELLARIRTALRQQAKLRNRLPLSSHIFSVNGLKVDYDRRLVSVNGKPIHLTPIEYRILVLLSHHAGKVLTHDHIIREIWGAYGSDCQVLRVNMANIRRKIEHDPADPRYILTEVRVGYRLADAEKLEK